MLYSVLFLFVLIKVLTQHNQTTKMNTQTAIVLYKGVFKMNKDVVDMIVQHHIKQEIDIKQLKIKSIHKDIIRLKQENRNIGDKVKSLYCNIGTNALKLLDREGSETAGYTYNDRVMRDHTTIDYLEKLQTINSMLINKHRSKIRVLKKELIAIKGEMK